MLDDAHMAEQKPQPHVDSDGMSSRPGHWRCRALTRCARHGPTEAWAERISRPSTPLSPVKQLQGSSSAQSHLAVQITRPQGLLAVPNVLMHYGDARLSRGIDSARAKSIPPVPNCIQG